MLRDHQYHGTPRQSNGSKSETGTLSITSTTSSQISRPTITMTDEAAVCLSPQASFDTEIEGVCSTQIFDRLKPVSSVNPIAPVDLKEVKDLLEHSSDLILLRCFSPTLVEWQAGRQPPLDLPTDDTTCHRHSWSTLMRQALIIIR